MRVVPFGRLMTGSKLNIKGETNFHQDYKRTNLEKTIQHHTSQMPSTTTSEIQIENTTTAADNTQELTSNISAVENALFGGESYEYDDEGFMPVVCALADVNTFGSHIHAGH